MGLWYTPSHASVMQGDEPSLLQLTCQTAPLDPLPRITSVLARGSSIGSVPFRESVTPRSRNTYLVAYSDFSIVFFYLLPVFFLYYELLYDCFVMDLNL